MNEVKVSARILSFPSICCCCGAYNPQGEFLATATRVTGKRVIRTQSRSWGFPLCTKCEKWMHHNSSLKKSSKWFWKLLAITCISGFLSWIFIASIGVIMATLTLISWIIAAKKANSIKPNAICTDPPVIYESWNGSVHTFILSNSNFADCFSKSNEKKLVA